MVAGSLLSCGRVLAGDGLLGHWRLQGDALDASGNGHHGQNHGVHFDARGPGGGLEKAARFDGRKAHIVIPHAKALTLGARDFCLAVWVHTDAEHDDVLGDIAGKFDPVQRRGFNLTLMNANVACSQANWRQVQFGIDHGKIDAQWTDCGRPGKSVYVHALAVHDGQLYAGTCEPGAGEAGHVYRYEGGSRWSDCGSPDPCNAVGCLAAYRGRLYAGVSKYRLRGSSLPESPNENPGGKVYRYEGDGRWTACGKVGQAEALASLTVFKGKLYASSTYAPAGVYEYDGGEGETWHYRGAGPENKRVNALAVFNGGLYGTSYDGGRIYRFEGGEQWKLVGTIPNATQTYGFAVHQGQLYVSTWPKGEVWRYVRDNEWVNCGRLGNELEVMGLAVYNGKLFGGTLPLANVYRYEDGTTWTPTGQLDRTPDVKYRRAWTMAVFQGKLFCGTLPSGRVYSLEAGKNVTWDKELAPGWRHIAAVRFGKQMKLFVDGQLVAASSSFDANDFDLTNEQAFTIGFGQHDHFRGLLTDLRLYDRALTAAEVGELANNKRSP